MTRRIDMRPGFEYKPLTLPRKGDTPRYLCSKRDALPKWVRKVFKAPGGYILPGHDFLDHIGGCGEFLIAEPYGLSQHGTKMLIDFCETYHLNFEIDACSQHYPTQTLCIIMWPKGEL
jgi:hypothetical protein